jgi:UDP-N-acetylglucosamine/UDP-N-acetyl-alpha-D-glucosaminouronate 4-epimerase
MALMPRVGRDVFGPRQDPDGPYAAVVPRWFAALIAGNRVAIHG